MPDSNAFLRWARLKQASKSPDIEADLTDIMRAGEPSAGDVEPDSPFDLASLPSIESITAHTDIAAFLNNGVPAELTRLALRRAWATDPTIRDFVGIAENQWDFNDPSAIPGFGPLDPTDNVADLLARVTNSLERARDVLVDERPAGDPIRQHSVNSEQPALEPTISPLRSSPDDALIPTAIDNLDAAEQADNLTATALPSQRTRRHGSALPR